jgi:UDP-N-acetylmuramate dehydrogenase
MGPCVSDTDTTDALRIDRGAPIKTWFGIGGGADRMAHPSTQAQLLECIRIDPGLRVLGDGANLLVDDDGVGELVVSLDAAAFTEVRTDTATGVVHAGAGANLPKLINETVRLGLGGLETLAGVPATLGGALVMNAGGAFGQISDSVARVYGVDRSGAEVRLERKAIDFGYRRSGLNALILTGVDLQLTPGDKARLRERQLEIMQYKKKSQPMADNSAGCFFKNPTLTHDVPELLAAGVPTAVKGQRIGAGMLIDRAGCKGMRVGGAEVSHRHANFVVTDPGARARDVLSLMAQVATRVQQTFGVTLIPEVVVWRRGS